MIQELENASLAGKRVQQLPSPASWKKEPNAVIYKARGVPIYGWIGVADRLKRRAAEAQVSRSRCGNTDGWGNRPGTGMWECPYPMAACDRGGAAQPCSTLACLTDYARRGSAVI